MVSVGEIIRTGETISLGLGDQTGKLLITPLYPTDTNSR